MSRDHITFDMVETADQLEDVRMGSQLGKPMLAVDVVSNSPVKGVAVAEAGTDWKGEYIGIAMTKDNPTGLVDYRPNVGDELVLNLMKKWYLNVENAMSDDYHDIERPNVVGTARVKVIKRDNS